MYGPTLIQLQSWLLGVCTSYQSSRSETTISRLAILESPGHVSNHHQVISSLVVAVDFMHVMFPRLKTLQHSVV
jgi:hypothetical protein